MNFIVTAKRKQGFKMKVTRKISNLPLQSVTILPNKIDIEFFKYSI